MPPRKAEGLPEWPVKSLSKKQASQRSPESIHSRLPPKILIKSDSQPLITRGF